MDEGETQSDSSSQGINTPGSGTSVSSTPGSSSPGARLAAAREQAGMTLPQVAERLRLDVATLQALESGRFQTLGAAVFVRGHLRHYAELVGLPLDEIDAAYAASSAKLAPQPDLRRTTTLPGNSPPRGVSLPPRAALIGAIVLVLVALVWWAMRVPPGQRHGGAASGSSALSPGVDGQGSAPLNTAGEPPTTAEPPAPRSDAAAASKPAAAAPKESAPPDATLRDGTPKDSRPRDAASAFRDAVLSAKGQAGPVADAAAAAGPAAAAGSAAAAAGSAAVAGPKAPSIRVRLMLRFNQDSWTEIYDAHGATLFHDFGGAGSERRVSGTAPLRVLLGNPDAVSIELDGHPVALKPAAESGRPQRFLLDSAGRLSDVPAPQAPAAPR